MMVGLLLIMFAIIVGTGVVALLANLALTAALHAIAAGVRRLRPARRS